MFNQVMNSLVLNRAVGHEGWPAASLPRSQPRTHTG
jgi:hypothetical protein